MCEATDEEILAHARVHARSISGVLDLDVSRLEWAVSARAKRRAGVCRYDDATEEVTIVLARRAYEAFDPAAFEAIVRHECIHAWEFLTYDEAGHGQRFRALAERLDAPVHCASFTTPRYVVDCQDDDCDWQLTRHRASRTVTVPERYRCGGCGDRLRVTHVDSGRTWTSASGYGGAKAALGSDW